MNNEIILFHWNILEMSDGKGIFVGLRYRGERDIPSLIADSKDLLLNYLFIPV